MKISLRVGRYLPTIFLLLVGMIGLLLRVYIISISIGCNDAKIWWTHAGLLKEHGLAWTYENTGQGTAYVLFNHPPLAGLYALFCRNHSKDSLYVFSVLLKLPGLASELMAAFLVAVVWRRRGGARSGALAFAAYSLALSSITVGAFHCNTDIVAAAFVMLACERSEQRHHGMAGVALAIAVSVKLIPLLISPVLFVKATRAKEKAWLLAGASIAVIPYLFFLGELGPLLKDTFGYVPPAEHWGAGYILDQLATHPFLKEAATSQSAFLSKHGRTLVTATAAIAAMIGTRRRCSVYAAASVALLGLLIFSPGFGVQYVVVAAPTLMAFDLGIGFVHATLCGLFASALYLAFMHEGVPYQATFTHAYPAGPAALGVLAWGYSLLVIARIVRREANLVR